VSIVAPAETAQQIALSRTVTADGVIERRVDLRGYPHHYLMIHSYFLTRAEGVRKVVIAAEVLRPYGWEPVNVAEVSGSQVYGFVCRAAFAAVPAQYTEPLPQS
jgi:hypothetical protein